MPRQDLRECDQQKNLLPTVLETRLNIFFKILNKIIVSIIFFKKQSLAYAIEELNGLINSFFNFFATSNALSLCES